MDIGLLTTLPQREYVSGIAEMIKHGLVYDAAYFDWLEQNMPSLLRREESTLAEAIRRSCNVKTALVAADDRDEVGLRALLNLGHTFGHALETLTNYTCLLHGEAVSIGIRLAAELSHKLGYIDSLLFDRVLRLLEAASLPTSVARDVIDRYCITPERVCEAML